MEENHDYKNPFLRQGYDSKSTHLLFEGGIKLMTKNISYTWQRVGLYRRLSLDSRDG